MSEKATAGSANKGSWILVAVCWTAVGVPLLWGIYRTVLKAAALFQ